VFSPAALPPTVPFPRVHAVQLPVAPALPSAAVRPLNDPSLCAHHAPPQLSLKPMDAF
jgi:hypothetical protein